MQKTFLKWAGNKQKVMPHIVEHLPSGTRLVEPFMGSASVFLNTDYQNYLLADINPTLINLYHYIQNEGQSFIDYCREFFLHNSQEAFLSYRKIFNSTEDMREKAAIFLYLNKHSFNGLSRFNSKGHYNVPFGRYASPYFPEKEMLAFLAKTKKVNVTFLCADYQTVLAQTQKGDVVYCDPPYIPISTTSSFVAYSQGGFTLENQKHLANSVKALAQKGIPSLVSNHDCEFARNIYEGSTIYEIQVQRFIAAKGASRKKVGEILAVFE